MSDLILMYNYYMKEYDNCWGDSAYAKSCKIMAKAYLKAIENMLKWEGEL